MSELNWLRMSENMRYDVTIAFINTKIRNVYLGNGIKHTFCNILYYDSLLI